MSVFWRCGLLILTVSAFLDGPPLAAQENVEAGKTPAQLYASDCAICHKSPQGLTKAGGLFGLQSFLREHYTASRETAAVIASYLKSIDSKPGATPARKRTAAQRAKGDEKTNDDKGKAESSEDRKKKSASAKGSVGPNTKDKGADGKAHEEKPPADTPAAKEPAKPEKSD